VSCAPACVLVAAGKCLSNKYETVSGIIISRRVSVSQIYTYAIYNIYMYIVTRRHVLSTKGDSAKWLKRIPEE